SANGSLTRGANATFNHNGDSITSNSPNINGVDVLGLGDGIGGVDVRVGDATYTGSGDVTGGQNGINIDGLDATATLTGGTIRGNNGDGISASSTGGSFSVLG